MSESAIIRKYSKRTLLFRQHSSCCVCDEEIALYCEMCPKCMIQSINFGNMKVNPLVILQFIDSLSFEQYPNYYVKKIIELQRFLLDHEVNRKSFNSIIESKCQCGEINERNITKKNNPHFIKCKSCSKCFCSNCRIDNHVTKNFQLSCKEYKKYYDVYHHHPFAQIWISGMLNNKKEHEKKNEKESKLESLYVHSFAQRRNALPCSL